MSARAAGPKHCLSASRRAAGRRADRSSPHARSQSVESLTDAFRLNLTALSLLALVVGMFLIYNTITFSVVQRRPMIGTLRCLGVTRREIFALILSETLMLAAIGGVLGLVLGIVLGRGAVALVTQTINDLYYVVNVRDIDDRRRSRCSRALCWASARRWSPRCAPAYEATSIAPITALKRIEHRAARAQGCCRMSAAVGRGCCSRWAAGLLLLTKHAGGQPRRHLLCADRRGARLAAGDDWLLMRAGRPLLGQLVGMIGRHGRARRGHHRHLAHRDRDCRR